MRRLPYVLSAAVVATGTLLATPDVASACRLGIGDRVWYDVNMNGVQDAGEPGLNGVTVTISPAYYDFASHVVVSSTVTHTGPGEFGDGYYLFSGADCSTEYTIAVDPTTLPTGYVPTGIRVGASAAVDSDDPSGTVATHPNTGVDFVDDIDFGFYPLQPPPPSAGTGTPGYWKNHPEAWPVESIIIGNVSYSKAQALTILGQPDGDKKMTMFRHLVATKLNLLLGTEGSCITEDVAAADQWFITYGPVGNPAIRANSGAWRQGSATAAQLDAYNNGLLCAPKRD